MVENDCLALQMFACLSVLNLSDLPGITPTVARWQITNTLLLIQNRSLAALQSNQNPPQ